MLSWGSHNSKVFVGEYIGDISLVHGLISPIYYWGAAPPCRTQWDGWLPMAPVASTMDASELLYGILYMNVNMNGLLSHLISLIIEINLYLMGYQ